MNFTGRLHRIMQRPLPGASDATYPIVDVDALINTALQTIGKTLGMVEREFEQHQFVTARGHGHRRTYLRVCRHGSQTWHRVDVRVRLGKQAVRLTFVLTREGDCTTEEIGWQTMVIPFKTPAFKHAVDRATKEAFISLFEEQPDT